MGICASIASEIHDDAYGQENAVYYREIGDTNGVHVIGSTYSHPGSKGFNQDSAILYQGYGIEDGAFCGVFDGHGKNGHIVSKLVRNRLPLLLLNQRNAIAKISTSAIYTSSLKRSGSVNGELVPSKNFMKWKEAGLSAFKVMDKELKLLDKFDFCCSGTTAVVVVKQGGDLVIANLGDSRAILGTKTENGIKAVQLSTDFKPEVPGEAERIRKCNGRVLALKEEPHIQRVWLPHEDSPGLAMSRAFGDFLLKYHGIISIPDISYHHISTNDQFLVLATDGVWDVLNNDKVISIVASADNEEAAAKAVVDASTAAWKRKFPNSNRDDCTVICLFLQNKSQHDLQLNI
ncbi:probable protein phosphatase 2C 72 [Olea europaea var. sylvestris]|uniref:probable protein phosphatase 2C 72 n=1 Tax=Olea europaea var. sylvestris TaxID=158386 RepID=UPI000C1CF974|nr:probable protein phosphatase 2C 72 [Olea europaea var. sylvestris]